MIERCWPHMKRVTIKKGAPKNRADREKVWREVWLELEQDIIQAWIERIRPDFGKLFSCKQSPLAS